MVTQDGTQPEADSALIILTSPSPPSHTLQQNLFYKYLKLRKATR